MKKRSDRFISIQKRSSKIYILIPAGILLAAAIVAGILYMTGFFYNKKDIQVSAEVSSEEMQAAAAETKIVPADMLSRTLSLLRDKTNTSPYVVSWCVLPGSVSSETGMQSEYLVAEDQALLLQYFVKSGNKDDARTLANAIEKDFAGEKGYLVPYRKVSELVSMTGLVPVFPLHEDYDNLPPDTEYSMEATVGYLKGLLAYYARWGQASDLERIERIADLLYTGDVSSSIFFEDLTINVATPTPLPTGADQDIVDVAEGEVSTGGSFSTVALASLDLDVFRMLGSLDSRYLPLYDMALAILNEGLVSDSLPLYAVGYSQASDGYVYYFGGKTAADLVSSLKVTLHLAEAGKVPVSTILWIKQHLYNDGALYASYDLINGLAGEETAALEAYGLLLKIARVTDDADLYSKTMRRLEANLATNSSSPARNSIFRQVEGTRVAVYAGDNLAALLGV